MDIEILKAELARIEEERNAVLSQDVSAEIAEKVERYKAELRRQAEAQKQQKVAGFAQDIKDLQSLISRRQKFQ